MDIDAPDAPAAIVKTRSYKREIMLFTSNSAMAGWGFHWVLQLRARGYEHWVILSDGADNCNGMHAQWDAFEKAHGEPALSCIYTSEPWKHEGWVQWRPHHGKVLDKMHAVYTMWASRWWACLKLLEQDTNVLSLDVDAVMLSDIYAVLRAPPFVHQDVIITQNNDESQSLNCGFVYFNRDAARSDPALQRPALESKCGQASGAAVAASGQPVVPAAEWVCKMVWERIVLFLDFPRLELKSSPTREVLWEQDVWNDIACSLDAQKRIFPWAVGYGRKSELWAQLGYERVVLPSHAEKFVKWNTLVLADSKGGVAAAEAPQGPRYHARVFQEPVRYIPLCAPPNVSSGAKAPVEPPALKTGIQLSTVLAHRAAPGRLMIAPSWLASLGNDPDSDWAGARPSPLTYVHITNMWKCYPHPCWSKAGRLYWLRAHGFWDRRLDDMGLTPAGAPYNASTKVLTLPSRAEAALAALASETRLTAGWPKFKARKTSFQKFAGLIHNLVTIATLIGRKPALPPIPCDFVRAVQQPNAKFLEESRLGISHCSFLVTGPAEKPVCHIMPATWRPGGKSQCYHTNFIAPFDLDRMRASMAAAAGPPAANASVHFDAWLPFDPQKKVVDMAMNYKPRMLSLEPLRKFCRAASAHANTPLLTLEGLLPFQELLIDRPLTEHEFRTERQMKQGGKPRWDSLVMRAEVRELLSDCPGARDLLEYRRQCVGFFLAE